MKAFKQDPFSQHLTRREFLKLAGLFPLTAAVPRILKPTKPQAGAGVPNVLVVVFDTLCALHVQLYGYGRETMPNLGRLAERATVYHNHYAAGSFTSPGTASLLTGTHPWTNRAFISRHPTAEAFASRNLFQGFEGHYRITYTHNPLVTTFLNQFSQDLELYKPIEELYIQYDELVAKLFGRDEDIASLSWINALKKGSDGVAYSLFLSSVYQQYAQKVTVGIREEYPRSLPFIGEDNFFLLEDAIDWAKNELPQTPEPFLGYFHFLPPHSPYATRKDFVNAFRDDGLAIARKPLHPLGPVEWDNTILKQRRWYDEYILLVDAEFNRLFTSLEQAGLLENTWVVLTSDHGELFERGLYGHFTLFLFEALLRVPLIIFEPGQTRRRDIYERTSAVDVLPTLLHISGQEAPDWLEGEILPPYRPGPVDEGRAVFAFDAKNSQPFKATTSGTAAIYKGPHKLVYYYGYDKLKDGPMFDLHDLEADPLELKNIYAANRSLAEELAGELMAKIEQADAAYR